MALKDAEGNIIKTDYLKYCVCHDGNCNYEVMLESDLEGCDIVVDSFDKLTDAKKLAILLIRGDIRDLRENIYCIEDKCKMIKQNEQARTRGFKSETNF